MKKYRKLLLMDFFSPMDSTPKPFMDVITCGICEKRK
jgi:hypothetical protein